MVYETVTDVLFGVITGGDVNSRFTRLGGEGGLRERRENRRNATNRR